MSDDGVTLRKARASDVPAIARLVNGFADEQSMLPRSVEAVALALDDYVVAVDERGALLGCGALTEYSPSVAEVSSIAVARDVQRRGLGGRIVRRVEELARVRGFAEVFLITVIPGYFATLGYELADCAMYPEKICAHGASIAHCGACGKVCMRRPVPAELMQRAA